MKLLPKSSRDLLKSSSSLRTVLQNVSCGSVGTFSASSAFHGYHANQCSWVGFPRPLAGAIHRDCRKGAMTLPLVCGLPPLLRCGRHYRCVRAGYARNWRLQSLNLRGLGVICSRRGQANRIVCRTRKLNPPVWVPRASVWVRGKCEDALEARSRAGFNSHLVTHKNARGRVVQPADLHGVR